MKEWAGVRQIPGEAGRRWFASSEFDLIVWMTDGAGYSGFELCYDKGAQERSLLWSNTRGFSHLAADDGEQTPGRYKQAPILVPDGQFDIQRVYSAFLEASRSLPQDIADLVLGAFERHPDYSP